MVPFYPSLWLEMDLSFTDFASHTQIHPLHEKVASSIACFTRGSLTSSLPSLLATPQEAL